MASNQVKRRTTWSRRRRLLDKVSGSKASLFILLRPVLVMKVHSVAFSWGDLHILMPHKDVRKSMRWSTTAVTKEMQGKIADRKTVNFLGSPTSPTTTVENKTTKAMIKKMKVFLELWSSRSFFLVSSTSSYSKALEFVTSILNTTAKWIRNRLTEINMISPILGEATKNSWRLETSTTLACLSCFLNKKRWF